MSSTPFHECGCVALPFPNIKKVFPKNPVSFPADPDCGAPFATVSFSAVPVITAKDTVEGLGSERPWDVTHNREATRYVLIYRASS